MRSKAICRPMPFTSVSSHVHVHVKKAVKPTLFILLNLKLTHKPLKRFLITVYPKENKMGMVLISWSIAIGADMEDAYYYSHIIVIP